MKAVLTLTVLLFTACTVAPPPQTSDAVPAGVRLEAGPAAGGNVQLTLHNDSGAEVGYNLCSSRLERLEASSARNVPLDIVCTMELRRLAPQTTAAFTHTLPAGLQPGQYRFVTNIESPLGATQATVASEPFTVR